MSVKWLQAGAAAAATGVVLATALTDASSAPSAAANPVLNTHQHFEATKAAARELVARRKEECGAPGISIAVNKNGRPLWAEGFGYADVELLLPMSPRHVLRIASISKPMTMALVGRAVDAGLLDVHAPLRTYLPNYPTPVCDGEKVDITTDQLAMHRAGIRHYYKKDVVEAFKKKIKEAPKNKLAHEVALQDEDCKFGDSVANSKSENNPAIAKEEKLTVNQVRGKKEDGDSKTKKKTKENVGKEAEAKEFLMAVKFDSVGESLRMFKDDELMFKPGSDFHYSTHGFTLIAAVLEAATRTKFTTLFREMCVAMGLRHTCLDENEPIIRNRARNYVRSDGGQLRNAPHVDNSYKWAGGGLLSTPADLCRFADAMLYSWQAPAGYLRPQTLRWLWTLTPLPASAHHRWPPRTGYARGWAVREQLPALGGGGGGPLLVRHTGGAAGCSSVLLIRPAGGGAGSDGRPQGTTVAIIANLQGVGLAQLAEDVAQLFADGD